jgi:rhodanese-related sulfurtransferase
MASKKPPKGSGYRSGAPNRRTKAAPVAPSRNKLYLAIAGGAVALVALIAIGFVALGGVGAKAAPSMATGETIFQGQGGHWTNVTPDRLTQMLTQKDFTLVNVKTPYIGEIDGTDLYIPYDQLSARASQLPADKSSKILVYCRSGVESAQAAQTLLNLGYTNVWNLDGGMNAWQSSGRTLVQKNRT